MYNDSLSFEVSGKKFAKSIKVSKHNIELKLRFDGINRDITEPYYWFFNFAYYTGKGYNTLKLEDYHHFTENSQFGTNLRQVKGGSIRAFQENLQQLIQLVKVHLFPLLKEVKQADFYHRWITKITEFDNLVQEELKKSKENQNEENLRKWRGERNEAINHLKDKWVMEVDGGRMWQMNRPATEQGLDFALLPQLFFGTSLDDPLCRNKSLKEQLDKDIYSIDISKDAKEQVARFMYRFYTWLPSAIEDTKVTFKLKLASLRQIYTQIQMYINFMRPLLQEIQRKTEGYDKQSLYHGFEMENPDMINLFDSSYSYVRTLGIREFERKWKYRFDALNYTPYGLYVEGQEIVGGKYAGKTGFVAKEVDGKYEFYPSDKKDITKEEFKIIKEKKDFLNKDDLKLFPCVQLEFIQKRRTEVAQTQQGPQQVPYMYNTIQFKGFSWNIVEVAAYRQNVKADDLELLETFIAEVREVKDEIYKYVNYFKSGVNDEVETSKKEESKSESSNDTNLFFGPFKGAFELIKPLVPSTKAFTKPAKSGEQTKIEANKRNREIVIMDSIEDTWKLYSIFKKTHGHMQY